MLHTFGSQPSHTALHPCCIPQHLLAAQSVRLGLRTTRLQGAADAKFKDYKPKVAFYFPGQGAQTVGMCKEVVAEVPAAKELFDRAAEIVGYDLLQICVEGEDTGCSCCW